MNGSVSSPQISRCASSDQCASDRPFDTAPLTVQPVEAQPCRDRHRDFQRDFAVILETAEHRRPAGAQQFGGADLLDDMREQIAVALGLLGESPNLGHQRARPRDQFVRARNRQPADRGGGHRGASPWPRVGPRPALSTLLRRGWQRQCGCGLSGLNRIGRPAAKAFEVLPGGRRGATVRRHHRDALPVEPRPLWIAAQRADIAAFQQSRHRVRARASAHR